MTRSSQLLFGAALSLLLAAAAPGARAADPPAATDAAQSIDPNACANTPDQAAQDAARQKREAALADLGRRLSVDAAEEEGGYGLNRTGHNYAPEDAPAAPPASTR